MQLLECRDYFLSIKIDIFKKSSMLHDLVKLGFFSFLFHSKGFMCSMLYVVLLGHVVYSIVFATK